VCYVAGRVRRDTHGLHILPTAVVYRVASGKRILQPWVDSALHLDEEEQQTDADEESADDASTTAPMELDDGTGTPCIHDLHACLGDLLTTGLALADGVLIDRLGEIAEALPEFGYAAVGGISARLHSQLDARRHRLHWEPAEARESLAALLQFLAIYPELVQASAL